jgi:predicted ATPase
VDNIHIQNYKCLLDVTIPVGSLTMLAGQNGSGKSSVIQALLLLRQSYMQGTLKSGVLSLNGPLINIGSAQDAISEAATSDTITFSLSGNEGESRWDFDYSPTASDVLASRHQMPLLDAYQDALFGDDFCYLQAERLGPRLYGDLAEHAVRGQRLLGERGELTAFFLNVFGNEEVSRKLIRHQNSSSNTLLAQAEAWLDEICPGIRISTFAQESMDLVRYAYAFEGTEGLTNAYRPTNVGFGVSYALPVIVAALSIKTGGILIVENPEAHLHPRGQSKMAELLARLAASDVHVIVETHSDHLLNGIRVAVKQSIIAPNRISIAYFEKERRSVTSRVCQISIDEEGRLDSWPIGFFDEYERALVELL